MTPLQVPADWPRSRPVHNPLVPGWLMNTPDRRVYLAKYCHLLELPAFDASHPVERWAAEWTRP